MLERDINSIQFKNLIAYILLIVISVMNFEASEKIYNFLLLKFHMTSSIFTVVSRPLSIKHYITNIGSIDQFDILSTHAVISEWPCEIKLVLEVALPL